VFFRTLFFSLVSLKSVCFNGVSRKFQGCFKEVSRVFKGLFKDFLGKFQAKGFNGNQCVFQ